MSGMLGAVERVLREIEALSTGNGEIY